jgi:hypothetical protein
VAQAAHGGEGAVFVSARLNENIVSGLCVERKETFHFIFDAAQLLFIKLMI